jgi:hypothetical protein
MDLAANQPAFGPAESFVKASQDRTFVPFDVDLDRTGNGKPFERPKPVADLHANLFGSMIRASWRLEAGQHALVRGVHRGGSCNIA